MSEENGKYLQRFIPARVVFIILGFFGFILLNAYKVVLSMTIIAMTNQTQTSSSVHQLFVYSYSSNECSFHGNNSQNGVVFPGAKLDWDPNVCSQVLESFFYGFILTQIPGGILSTKYGGKWILGSSLVISAVLSLLSPFSAKIDYRLFMAVRIGQGLAEGVIWPASNTLISQWVSKMERTRGSTIIQSGSKIGTVITLPLAAIICKSDFMGSWEFAYYLLGIVGFVWFILWSFLVFESPEKHPHISKRELDYILTNDGGLKIKENSSIPYRQILTSIPVIALVLTHFGQNWGYLTVLNLMPTYMNNVLHMQINENIIISGLPYLGQAFVAWAASYVSDKLRQSGRFEITSIRKANTLIAYLPAAICFALIPLASCNTTLSPLLFILAMSLNGACFSGLYSTRMDMAPDHAGLLMGITATVGNLPGVLTTIVADLFTTKGQTVHNWSFVFYISSGVFVVTGLIYCCFATAKEQFWGRYSRNCDCDCDFCL